MRSPARRWRPGREPARAGPGPAAETRRVAVGAGGAGGRAHRRARAASGVTVVPDPAATPPQTARVANVANALTLLRLLLVPVFGWALLREDGQDTVWRLVAFASYTDRLDGDLARRRGLVTEVGKLADPIADKALTGTALVGLSVLDLLPWWVTLVILVREVGITLLRFWVIRHGVIAASRGGKAKTVVQSVAIGLYLLPLDD